MINSCPRCGDSLAQKAFGAVAVDGCDSCGGIWFDYRELNQLTRDPEAGLMEVERAFNRVISGEYVQGDMKCPKCPDSALYGFSFPHTPNVSLDACPKCKGIWVDDGELQKIAERLAAAQQPSCPPVRQPETTPVHDSTTPVALPLNREQIRCVTSFLLSAPCPDCGMTNPASCTICWQCGSALKTRSVLRLCPSCDVGLEEHSIAPNTLMDVCLQCGGVWFEAGEMSVLFQLGEHVIREAQAKLTVGRGSFAGRGTLAFMAAKCPGCHYLMERKGFGGGSEVKIDVCNNCKGVWLDAGELLSAYELVQGGAVLHTTGRPADPWGND